MAYITAQRGTDLGVFARLRSASRNFGEWRARRAVYRRTLDELCALSDRDLADLGMSRSEAHRIAREAAFGL